MTQNAIQITTTPPLPGLQLVQNLNDALATIATNFAGPTDPAAFAPPYSIWVDTASGLIKRRNAAGTAWVVEGSVFANMSAGRLIGVRTSSSTFNHVPTPGMQLTIAKLQGAGGAGGGSGGVSGTVNLSLGAPGAGGAFAVGLFTATQIGASILVTVGAGGQKFSNANGGTGGTTSLGSLMSATGGPGGLRTAPGPTPSAAGNGGLATPSGGNLISINGQCQALTVGHSSLFGLAGEGGGSVYGPGAPMTYLNTNGVDATNPGTGGSGSVVNVNGGTASGGAGANGFAELWEYA